MLVMPAHELMQGERDFVRMRCAPRNNALQLERIVGDAADFHQLGFDDLRVSHRNFRMAHFGARIPVRWAADDEAGAAAMETATGDNRKAAALPPELRAAAGPPSLEAATDVPAGSWESLLARKACRENWA